MTYTPTTQEIRNLHNPEAFDRWLAETIQQAQAEGARIERERIATLAEGIHQAHDIAECAGYVEGETGRQECIDQWIALCEEPDAWLRELADDPDWLYAQLFNAWENGAFDAAISLGHGGHNATNPYTEKS